MNDSKKKLPRPIKALPFVMTLLFLTLWNLGFTLFAQSAVAESLRCLLFFGGLGISVFLGIWLGQFLQRLLSDK